MLCLYSLVNDVEALPECLSPVLVSDTYVFEVEWLRMAHCSSLGTPFAIDVAVAEFDEIENIVYKD